MMRYDAFFVLTDLLQIVTKKNDHCNIVMLQIWRHLNIMREDAYGAWKKKFAEY